MNLSFFGEEIFPQKPVFPPPSLELTPRQVATQSIAEDEELFAIPLNLVLNVKNSKASELLTLDDEDLDPWLSLIVVMISEFLEGGTSQWAPYFRVLPSHFDTLMFWTDDELRELQGSTVVDKIGKKDADTTFTERVLPLIIKHPDLFPPINGLSSLNSPEGRQFLLSLAHRMGSLIMAYAFDIEKDEPEDMSVDGQDGYVTDEEDEGEDVPKGMVPLADTLNADADRNNVSSLFFHSVPDQDMLITIQARLFQEDEFFIMKSIKPIAAGEEIFNDYGELPRADLVRRYGYVTDNYAKYDVVEFSLDKLCAFAGLESADPGPNTPQVSGAIVSLFYAHG
jgi:SET domain-containing protein 6